MSCTHPPNRVVVDAHEGTEVCTECCRVLTSSMEMSTIQHGSNPTLFIGPKPTNDILDRVLDKCYCGDYESITSLAECHFDRLVDMLPLHNKTEIAAYAVYATLIQRNTPRSFTEIANLVGIRERTLYKLHSIYHKVERIPSDEVGLFVDRACAFLNLPFELETTSLFRQIQLYCIQIDINEIISRQH